ncbi:hypothetical protein G6N82_04050 [Altererythrobacter sp. BO-6]|uniref:hypothetical protein n=1 Tax=Altererythrobacter sp. BO-6 TaxID=2604537 RepID=UPI0013E0FC84|nr:hypothetical protein [Altererythrobacter sp. BO-6]QIG53429.1 hypothetical protein G6N82_04050 [Altererythrobacter sp. BO-6]
MRLAIALAALTMAAPAQAEHLYPRDECGSAEGAESFRLKLATAVANRDEAMLQPLVAPDIKLSFGGDYGWETMREWLRDPNIRLWDELDKVLALGCSSQGGDNLSMPWLWGQDLGFDDPFSTFVVVGKDVPLRAAPEPGAPVLRRLNWEAVQLLEYPEDGGDIVRILTRQGEVGFTDFASLRSQIDYRLLAERQNGEWIIQYFLAGD